MRLHYHLKLKIRVFVNILTLEKQNSTNYLLTLISVIEEDETFWLWYHVMANLLRNTYIKHYQNRLRFVKDMTKTFWCVFGLQFNCCSFAKREC